MEEELEPKTIKELFEEAEKSKGLTVEKLAELTDVPERYLLAIRDADSKNLPAPPYIRGYIFKVARVFNIDENKFWEIYKESVHIKTSGAEDVLPPNRFALKTFSRKKIFFIVLGIVILVFLGLRAEKILGNPSIDITNPAVDNLTTGSSKINLSGKVKPADKLTVIAINDEEAAFNKDGYFQKEFSLEPGLNTIEFKARRFLGKEVIITRKIIYQ